MADEDNLSYLKKNRAIQPLQGQYRDNVSDRWCHGDAHLHFHLFPRVSGDLGKHGDKGKGPVWWLPKRIMWNKSNIPNMDELEKMKEKLLKVL